MQDVTVILEALYGDALLDAAENFDAETQKNTAVGGVKYSKKARKASMGHTTAAYSQWDVETALCDALDHADKGQDNLIRVGNMPHFVVNTLGIDGDFYIYRNHAYENMVSEKQVYDEGRYSAKSHYHDIGLDKMVEAIMSLENPVLTVATKTKDGNPAVIMVLPVS